MTKKKRVKVLCKNSKCEYMIYEMYDHEGTISYLLFIYILIWFKKKKKPMKYIDWFCDLIILTEIRDLQNYYQ